MKKRILKAIGIGSLAIIGAGYFGQIWVSGQSNESILVGSWDASVTARDCETGTPIPFIPVFPALITYDRGGTMQETDLGALAW